MKRLSLRHLPILGLFGMLGNYIRVLQQVMLKTILHVYFHNNYLMQTK